MAAVLKPCVVMGICKVKAQPMKKKKTIAQQDDSAQMNIVIVGHVDHGKSTLIGRLLADTGSLPEGKLEQIKELCRRTSKPFEYAFLLDALKDERDHGITIDMARCFFKSKKRNYIIIDAPGHIDFLKNMVTGAARAEAAVLVIDAKEGIRENSKRHGYLLSMLGIKQVIVCVNKMDLVDYNESVYDSIVKDYTAFLSRIGIHPKSFIPISAREGENLIGPSRHMKWGPKLNILAGLDSFVKEESLRDKPFRMYLQDVYKFTSAGDDRRICAGKVESGVLNVGDEIIFLPSQKKSRVKTIEGFNEGSTKRVTAPKSTGFTLSEQVYTARGELIARTSDPLPKVTTRVRTNIFWLGRDAMVMNKPYHLKIGTAKVPVRLVEIKLLIDASEELATKQKDRIERLDVADCVLETVRPIAFDLSHELEPTSRFVVVDGYEISGGGIIKEALHDETEDARNEALLREIKFERGAIGHIERVERYNQKSTLIVVTGQKDAGQKKIAKALEEKFFNSGKHVYFLGMGSIKYSVDSDLIREDTHREEHLRRLGEISYLLLDSGLILIVSARDLDRHELNRIKTLVEPYKMLTVAIGIENLGLQDIIEVDSKIDVNNCVTKVEAWLKANDRIFHL